MIFLVFQTKQILERHLKIGEALSVEQLVQRTKDDGGVRMLRGFFDLKFKEADDGEGLLTFEFEISISETEVDKNEIYSFFDLRAH